MWSCLGTHFRVNGDQPPQTSLGSNRYPLFWTAMVSTLSTTARPTRSRATWATWGAAIRHGPHHEAQKSTKTGALLSRTTSSNSAGLTSMGSADAGSAVLQAPHLPASARCFAGIRFAFPHDGQFRITAMTISSIDCHVKRNTQALS